MFVIIALLTKLANLVKIVIHNWSFIILLLKWTFITYWSQLKYINQS